jgi:hypothetical protein
LHQFRLRERWCTGRTPVASPLFGGHAQDASEITTRAGSIAQTSLMDGTNVPVAEMAILRWTRGPGWGDASDLPVDAPGKVLLPNA